ncbi:uncharacterized protein LOC106661165 isoform X2 [Cimex lectularius]|uniref:Uncharacterized protein n=1 Tax=Cimex lectularius TaxID=79782 RepID=A0A8I6TCS2_CIMLE|nr:uncharacterized protein LOC106661165 isoform X2 [Cimex lectularius]
MHFSQSRGLVKFIHKVISRQLLSPDHCQHNVVGAYGTIYNDGEEKNQKTYTGDPKKYLYQIPPWLQKKAINNKDQNKRENTFPKKHEYHNENEILVKENKCKTVYKMKRRISPIPTKHNSIQVKLEKKNEKDVDRAKPVPHITASSIALESPIKLLHSKNLQFTSKKDIDPTPMASEPIHITDPFLTISKKPSTKKKLYSKLQENSMKKKKDHNLRMAQQMEEFKARHEDNDKVKKKVVIPKNIESLNAKSTEEKKKLWKDLMDQLDIPEAQKGRGVTKFKSSFQRNKLIVEFPNKPIKLSSKEMLYSKIGDKKKTKKSKDIVEKNKTVGSSYVNPRELDVDSIPPKNDPDISMTASMSIKALKEKKAQSFNESVMILRKEGERLRKEYEKNKQKNKVLQIAKPTGKAKGVPKIENKKVRPQLVEAQLLNYYKRNSFGMPEAHGSEEKTKVDTNIKREKFIPSGTKSKRQSSKDNINLNVKSNESNRPKTSITTTIQANTKLKPSDETTSNIAKLTRPMSSLPQLTAKNLAKEHAKYKILSNSINHIPARLILPKHPGRTVFDNTFAKVSTSSQANTNEGPNVNIEDSFVAQPLLEGNHKIGNIKLSKNEKNDNVVKINEPKENEQEANFGQSFPVLEKVELKTESEPKVDTISSEMMLSTRNDASTKEEVNENQKSSLPSVSKNDFSRLPKEIKDALTRLNSQTLQTFTPLQQKHQDLELNLRKALINYQINNVKLPAPQGTLNSQSSITIQSAEKKLDEEKRNLETPEEPVVSKKILVPNNKEDIEIKNNVKLSSSPQVKRPKTTPVQKVENKKQLQVIDDTKVLQDSIVKAVNTVQKLEKQSSGLHNIISKKAKDLFSKYKCYLDTAIRSWDINSKIKEVKEKNSIILLGGGNVLNKIHYQSKKSPRTSSKRTVPQKEVKAQAKPKVLRNSKFRRNLYNKSNNYYIKIKTKPAKKKIEKQLNMEGVNNYLEPDYQVKKIPQTAPAMAYSEVLSAVYNHKRVSKFV